jgi:hypothetical protein
MSDHKHADADDGYFRVIIELDPFGRVSMTRDMELIRTILLKIQERKDLKAQVLKIDGVEDAVLSRHVEMLFQKGFLDGSPVTNIPAGLADILIRDLSWSGHDFASAVRNDGIWSNIKKSFSPGDLATMPLSVIRDVAVGLLKEWAKKQVGLSD